MISKLLNSRRIFVELVIGTILLALSINLLSSSIIQLKWVSPQLVAVIAIIIIIVSIIYFVVRLLWPHDDIYKIDGFFIWDENTNNVLDIKRYHFGYYLNKYLKAAFIENSALEKAWNLEPISKEFNNAQDIENHNKNNKSKKIIVEATEYYILEELSTHLVDYFNQEPFDEQNLEKFARNDIPDVLLSNRFLEMFSKPMEDRPLFSNKESFENDNNIVMSTSDDGAFYSQFELILPKNASIKRAKPGGLTIKTTRFQIDIAVDFEAFGALVPTEYKRFILQTESHKSRDFQITASFKIKFKFASLFLPGGWSYYRWIESFMKVFEKDFSEERFFKDIKWDSCLTIIQYLESQHKNQKIKVRT